VPVVNVEGRLYDVKVHYLDRIDKGRYLFALPPHALPGQLLANPEVKPEMFEAVAELVQRICEGEWSSADEREGGRLGAILIFLPGAPADATYGGKGQAHTARWSMYICVRACGGGGAARLAHASLCLHTSACALVRACVCRTHTLSLSICVCVGGGTAGRSG
jgi:hypothetical protein